MESVPQVRPWKLPCRADEFVLAGVKARELHRAFDGFCAAVGEERFGAGRAA